MSELLFTPTRGTGTLLSIAALLALNGVPTSHLRNETQRAAAEAAASQEAQTAHERAAREAIAARFATCVITGVDSDTYHLKRNVNIGDGGDAHGRLDVSVRVSDTPAATAFLREYDQDDAVTWAKPEVRIAPVDNSMRAINTLILSTSVDGKGSPFDSHETETTGHFKPRRVYPDGAKAGIFASQEAATYAISPTDNALSITRTTGETYCGAIIMQNGAWVKETPPTIVLPNTLVTKTTE